MMNARIPRTVASVAGVLALLALQAPRTGDLAAQGFGGLGFEAWGFHLSSNQPTLERGAGAGFGVVLGLESVPWLSVSVSFAQVRSRSERDGITCQQFTPLKAHCLEERLTEGVTLSSFRVSALPSRELTYNLRLDGGLGFSVSELRAESRGIVSGRLGDLFTAPSAHVGGFLKIDLVWAPFLYVPLEFLAGGTSHMMWFDGCREGDHTWYAPYCGGAHLLELRAGLAYRIEF